jgi:hypothetical protein
MKDGAMTEGNGPRDPAADLMAGFGRAIGVVCVQLIELKALDRELLAVDLDDLANRLDREKHPLRTWRRSGFTLRDSWGKRRTSSSYRSIGPNIGRLSLPRNDRGHMLPKINQDFRKCKFN